MNARCGALVLAASAALCPLPALGQRAPWAPSEEPSGARSAALDPPRAAAVSRPLRVLAEVGGALLGGAAGAGLGAGLGFLLPVERFREVAPFSAFAVALFAMPAGVTFAGHQMHGNGGLGWSAAGLLGGAVLALPLIALAERSSAFQGTIAVVFPLAGAIIGYEVSSDDDARSHPEAPRVVPTALVVPGGALAGLAGRF